MATFGDLDAIARALPGVDAVLGQSGRPEYRVGGRAFAFLRSPRKDAIDPDTGERMDDVIVLRTPGLEAKEALLADATLPLFTTPHFHGWPGVLVRECDLGRVPRERLAELLESAWEARAPRTLVREWGRARERSLERTPSLEGGEH